MEEVNRAIVHFIKSYVAEKCRKQSQISIGPLNYQKNGVKVVTTVSHTNDDRSPCSTVTFMEDIAHPNFFQKLESYLDECMSFMR